MRGSSRVIVAALVLAVASSACLTPVAEEGFESAGSDAGARADGGQGAVDAGLPDAGQPPVDFTGRLVPSCAPNDGPAVHFDLVEGDTASCSVAAAAFTVDLYTSSPEPKRYTVAPGFGGDGSGWTCSAMECFGAQSGSVTVEAVSGDVVEGKVELTFSNGLKRQGTFRAVRCGADAGFPPVWCG